MTPQQTIVETLRRVLAISEESYRKAYAEHAGAVAAAKAWDRSNPEDGVGCLSGNPYRPDSAAKYMERKQLEYERMRAAYEYAIDTFLENDTNDECSSDPSDN